MKALAADWLQEDLKYQDVAQITGYKYQTIANFVSGKKTYFSAEQAKRFEPMGYRMEFLMFGTGCLKKEDDIESAVGKDGNSLPDDFKLSFLMNCFKNIADIYDEPLMQAIYKKFHRAITTEDVHTAAECFAEIQQCIAIAMVTHNCGYDENGVFVRYDEEEPNNE